jgi:hypothetical protein
MKEIHNLDLSMALGLVTMVHKMAVSDLMMGKNVEAEQRFVLGMSSEG